jgi:hypothetical protein
MPPTLVEAADRRGGRRQTWRPPTDVEAADRREGILK